MIKSCWELRYEDQLGNLKVHITCYKNVRIIIIEEEGMLIIDFISRVYEKY